MKPFVLIWGGGDLASGVALRLYHAGIKILMVEQAQPLAVRRSVSFAQAVYDGSMVIEGITGIKIDDPDAMRQVWEQGKIPVLVDPDLSLLASYHPVVLVDARMRKKHISLALDSADLVIGLGPGFTVGENCHAAVETNRGHFLGRAYWKGSPEPDTGIPGQVKAYARERILHAPTAGFVEAKVAIGDQVAAGDCLLVVNGMEVPAPFDGVVRGLIQNGITVKQGMKIGDVDPRPETFRCWFVSEKSLAIGGGVLEAMLTKSEIRHQLWKA